MIAERRGFLISGGTGTGKTTLLNALLGLCTPQERLILLEDTPELAPQHEQVIALKTRAANSEGAGEIGLGALIVQALRMGPDRLVVGECRGAEVVHLLTAMNTGHRGAGTTLHANSAQAVPLRLCALRSPGWIVERSLYIRRRLLNALSTWNTGTVAAASRVSTACIPRLRGAKSIYRSGAFLRAPNWGTSPRKGETENVKGGSNEAKREE